MARLFSVNNTFRLGLGLVKLLVITGVAALSLYSQREAIVGLSMLDLPELASSLVHILLATTMKIALALFVLALLDYGFQRWKHEQDLKMTPQELREEMKNLETNPQLTSRRRQVQRQLAVARLVSAIPKADIVLSGPGELAVAIQYRPESMSAPIVVAKGSGTLAGRIRQLALQHRIAIVEKRRLARTIYHQTEINQPIHNAQYGAVAELLAPVYQAQGRQAT
jgi:flagellar biosynthetic protein FlhB